MNQKSAPDVLKTATIIYSGLIISQVIYGVALVRLSKFDLGAFSPDPMIILLLSMAALIPVVGSMLARNLISKAKGGPEIMNGLIIGWALAETACVFGFVASMISGQGMPYLAAFAYSLSFFVRLRPSRELFNKVLSPSRRSI